MYSSLKLLKLAEFYDNINKFALSDRITKLAQISNITPELLEFLAKSTDREAILQALQNNNLDTVRKMGRIFSPDLNPSAKDLSTKLFQKIQNVIEEPSQPLDDLSEDFAKLFESAAKATGTAGEAAGTAGEAGEVAKATGAAGEAAGAAKATGTAGEAAGVAGEAAGAAKATAQAEGVMGKALANPTFQKILGMFQKAAPAMKWLPPVAVGMELATKALTKPDELDGFDFGKLIAGMMLVPPVAAAISAIPVIGPALVALAGVSAFGGLDVARFATDPKKGLDLMGVNVAIKDQDYDKAIDQAIQVALARIHAKQSLIKTAHNLSTRSDKIAFLSYLLTKLAEKNMIEENIKTAKSNSRIKIAQTNENFFEKAGIDPSAYTGTADQNERLRKAINPSSPDFATAFEKKFGTWIKTPSERIPYLTGNMNSDAGGSAGQNTNGQPNSDFEDFLIANSYLNSYSLAGIASSIKKNVDTVAQVDLARFKLSRSDEKTLQAWVQSQVNGAEKYKTESTTTFSGLGVGESRKNEVLMITESMAKIAQIKEKFKTTVSGGTGNAKATSQSPSYIKDSPTVSGLGAMIGGGRFTDDLKARLK